MNYQFWLDSEWFFNFKDFEWIFDWYLNYRFRLEIELIYNLDMNWIEFLIQTQFWISFQFRFDFEWIFNSDFISREFFFHSECLNQSKNFGIPLIFGFGLDIGLILHEFSVQLFGFNLRFILDFQFTINFGWISHLFIKPIPCCFNFRFRFDFEWLYDLDSFSRFCVKFDSHSICVIFAMNFWSEFSFHIELISDYEITIQTRVCFDLHA